MTTEGDSGARKGDWTVADWKFKTTVERNRARLTKGGDLVWVEPEADSRTAKELRGACQRMLSDEAKVIALAEWGPTTELEAVKERLLQAVEAGVDYAVNLSRKRGRQSRVAGELVSWLIQLPVPEELPHGVKRLESLPMPTDMWPFGLHQVVAYRLAASVMACIIREKVEDLHAEASNQAFMPAFNREMRSGIFAFLLSHPAEAWFITGWARGWVEAGRGRDLPDFMLADV